MAESTKKIVDYGSTFFNLTYKFIAERALAQRLEKKPVFVCTTQTNRRQVTFGKSRLSINKYKLKTLN